MDWKDPALVRARDLLRIVHDRYVRSVSSNGMALSLETSALVWVLCDSALPQSILDMGSGFSSFVVRKWVQERGRSTIVWTVDDDVVWLDKSKLFCERESVGTSNFEPWSSFKERQEKFDLVIYDLGRMSVRFENIGRALDFKATNGAIVIDDMHKFNYHNEVIRILAERSLTGIDMREATLDSHEDRHCWLVRA